MEERTENTNNEKLLQGLINAMDKNTQSIEHLEEYLILKDKEKAEQEQEEKEAAEEQLKKEQEDQEVKDQETAKAAEESAAKADAQTETYTELLSDGIAEIQLTNQLLSVQTIYFGIVIGLLFIKIFFDNIKNR